MKIHIFGTRGSMPAPTSVSPRKFHTEEFGGDTTCLYVEANNGDSFILDAGTGIKQLEAFLSSSQKQKEDQREGKTHLLLTHYHLDHVQGLPFFGPAYNPESNIQVIGQHRINTALEDYMLQSQKGANPPIPEKVDNYSVEDLLGFQYQQSNFPVPFEALKGLTRFQTFGFGPQEIYSRDGLKIETSDINHPGGAVSYKFTETKGDESKSFVFMTDYEANRETLDENVAKWWDGANLVIADGQYEHSETYLINPFRPGFGHTSNITNVDLAEAAAVSDLLLTHHEPTMDDKYHKDLENRTQDYASKRSNTEVYLARQGDILEV